MGFSGVVFRSDNGSTLVDCVHRVAVGDFWLPAQLMQPEPTAGNVVRTDVRDRLTPNEMRLLSRVAIGLMHAFEGWCWRVDEAFWNRLIMLMFVAETPQIARGLLLLSCPIS